MTGAGTTGAGTTGAGTTGAGTTGVPTVSKIVIGFALAVPGWHYER